MIDKELLSVCKKLRPVIGRKADALWLMYSTASSLRAKQEAEAMIHLISARELKSPLKETTLLPPPSEDASQGEFHLGTVFYGSRQLHEIHLKRENLMKHIGIYSITGGGKTNLCQHLLLSLLKEKVPFLVIDWKRSYRSLLSIDQPGSQEIRVFPIGRASPIKWNPLRAPPGVNPKTWISLVAETLEKSHVSGQGVADIFIELFDKKFQEFGVYSGEFDEFPNFFDAREELERTRFKGRRLLWQDSCLRILRTFTFGAASASFNSRDPLKLETLLDQAVVFELDQELPKPLRVFFSELLLRWIHLYRLSQGETPELRHVTVLEEVHILFPRSNLEKQASNSIENLFREIRGFGEGLITITQHPSLLPIYVLGNTNTQIYLGLQHEEDIMAAKRALFLENQDIKALNSLQVGEGIVKIKGRVDPCLVKFPLVPIDPNRVSDEMISRLEGADGRAGVD